jgi:hypothetical protein
MKKIWIGRVVSALPAILLIFSGVLKLMRGNDVVTAFRDQLGWSPGLLVPIGVIEIACVIVYVIPQTAVLGAILMTGYLGGAMATELRVGSAHWIGPFVFGILAWLGLWLREERLKPVLPTRGART